MIALAFFDTNILVYADDDWAPQKQKTANDLLEEYGRESMSVVSVQVLQEYFATVTRKLGFPSEFAQRKIELLAKGKVVCPTERDVLAAIELHRLHMISFWDAMIIQTARAAGAKTLFSEDLQHGRSIVGVDIRNPFLAVPS